MMGARHPRWWGAALLGVALAAASAARLWLGRDPSSGAVEWAWPSGEIVALRVGALASAAVAGASLGLSGLLLQVLLRNPLASPFVLGLSSGAGLGATVAAWALGSIAAGAPGSPGIAAAIAAWVPAHGAFTVVPATAGALATLGIVLLLGTRRGLIDPVAMVLSGVVIAAICGALTLVLQQSMPPASRADAATWFLGRIPEIPDRSVLIVAVVALGACMGWAFRAGRQLDLASTSDDEARSLGVRLGALRLRMYLASGALAATSVALCGPVAFVGFIAPHLARLLLGARHGPLVGASVCAGALTLVVADAARQALDIGAGRLPIGVLTALVGGPAFLLVLRSMRGQGVSS